MHNVLSVLRSPILLGVVTALAVAAAGVSAQAALLNHSDGGRYLTGMGCLPWQKCAAPFHPSCTDASTLPLGIIARVRDGIPMPAAIAGHSVEPLLLNAGRDAPIPGGQRLVFIDNSAQTGDGPARIVYAIHNDARFENAGIVGLKAREPALCTWNYQLSDKPAAGSLIAPVTSAIVRTGLASLATIENGGTMWDVTDDPLDSAQLIVIVDIAGAPEPPRAPNAPTVFGLRAIAAFVDRATHNVKLVGFAPAWDSPADS